MEITTFLKMFHPRTLKRYYEVFPLIGAVGFAGAFCLTTIGFEFYSRTDVEWNRWSKDPQYVKFISDDRKTKYYWYAKPEDTAPQVIKDLRRELALPKATEDK